MIFSSDLKNCHVSTATKTRIRAKERFVGGPRCSLLGLLIFVPPGRGTVQDELIEQSTATIPHHLWKRSP